MLRAFFFRFLRGRFFSVFFSVFFPFSSSVFFPFSAFSTLAGSARGAALLGRPGGLWAGLLGWSLGHFPCPGVFLTFSIRFLYVFYYSSDAEAFLGKHCPGSPVAGPVWFLSVFVRFLCVSPPFPPSVFFFRFLGRTWKTNVQVENGKTNALSVF